MSKELPVDVAQPDDTPFAITDLAPTARALVALKSTQTELDLLAMAAKHTGLTVIKDKAGREQVHGAAMELMRARTAIKKTADEVRDDAKKFNAAVIAEEKRLTAIVEAEELRLKKLRDDWDAEQERIKAEAERIERERVLALGARIQEIRGFTKLAGDCRSSDAVRRLIERLATIDMTGFAEFEDEAISVLTETRQQVEQTLNTRLATEAEAARLKAEREELARQQAEAKQKAEELAAQQKAEADKLAADRAEFARQQKEAADKLAEQQAEVARMRAELEAAKATVPAVVAPEKQALADAVREIAGVGIAVADELLTKTYPNGAPMYSTTVFRDDGKPIMLTPEGKRSIFCDLDEGDLTYGPEHLAPQPAPGLSFDARGVLVPDADLVDVVLTDTAAVIGIDMGTDTPPAASLIQCIAFEYGVDHETACSWLVARAADFESWVPAVADIA